MEADVEQVKTRVNAEVAQIREQATQELDRVTTLESGVRASSGGSPPARLIRGGRAPMPTSTARRGRTTVNGTNGGETRSNGTGDGTGTNVRRHERTGTNGNGTNGTGATAESPAGQRRRRAAVPGRE